jgi:hypothetical protein
MKVHCKSDGRFKGLVPDIATYEKLKRGEVDWKPNTKAALKTVEIPFELFTRLMELDIEKERK